MQARESMLSPNLHFATCQLLRHELRRAPAAFETEWFMERSELCHVFNNLFIAWEVSCQAFTVMMQRNATTQNNERKAEIVKRVRIRQWNRLSSCGHFLHPSTSLVTATALIRILTHNGVHVLSGTQRSLCINWHGCSTCHVDEELFHA
jgi:hypothetical protein